MLAEWDVRCELGGVHNAIAYLYGLIKKAVEGAFKLWAARKSTPQQTPMQAVSKTASMARCPPFSIAQQASRKACVARGRATASGSDQAHAEDTIAARRADHRLHG